MHYTISGLAVTADHQQPLGGLVVEAFYRLGGQVLKSDKGPTGADGIFKFGFSDALLANATANKPVEVFFQVYRGNQLLPSNGGIARLVAENKRVQISVNVTSDNDAPADGAAYRVRGVVTRPNGRPEPAVVVQAFDRDLRSEQALGKATTDAKGQYEITYTPAQFRRAERQSADLVLRVRDASGAQLVQSDMLYNAPQDATVDLVIPSTLRSEFEQATDDALALMTPEGVTWLQLVENDTHQDVTFLSHELGLDPQRVTFLIIAHRFAGRTGLEAAAFYGWFRYGLPAQLPSLLLQDRGTLRQGLQQSAADNVIPGRFGTDGVIDAVLAQLDEVRVSEALRKPAAGDAAPALAGLIRVVLKDRPRQTAFMRLWVAHRGAGDSLWEAVRKAPKLAAAADALEFVVQTGALSGNHRPLVEALQRQRDADDLKTLRDLVRFDENGWFALLQQPLDDGIVGAPDVITGEGEEQLRNYASLLTHSVERSFPTAFVAERLKHDEVDNKAELTSFLDANSETFDITGPRLKTFLSENPRAFDTVPADKRPAVARQLRALQRVYRVAPRYQAARVLLNDGLDSAAAIARMSRSLFSRTYGHADALGDAETAERVHARACNAQNHQADLTPWPLAVWPGSAS